jgi:hypothetical protein
MPVMQATKPKQGMRRPFGPCISPCMNTATVPHRHEHSHSAMPHKGMSGKSVALIQARPPGHFKHVSITTPIVSALKNYCAWGFLEAPTGVL